VTSIRLVHWKSTLVADVSLTTKRLKPMCDNGWEKSQ
jgi:hypothetical protein